MAPLPAIVYLLAGVLLLVVLPYSAFERRHRAAWRKLATRRAARGGPYRRSCERSEHVSVSLLLGVDPPKSAPLIVRAAALSCFSLGAGCVPVSAIALSMIVLGDAIGIAVLIPALVLLRLWGAGMRLLEPDVDSLRSVRTAARWLVHASLPLALASVPLSFFVGVFPAAQREGVMLVLALGAFSLLCLAECALLARASSAAARCLPDEAGDRVRRTLAIPAWMHRVIARKLVRT